MKKGLTFIEVIISIAIFAIISTAVFMVMTFGNFSWRTETALLALHQQMRSVIDGMSREIRQSSDSTIVVSPDGQRVDFSIPDITNPISYYLNAGQLVREHPAGTTRNLMEGVTALQFSLSGNTLDIQLGAAEAVQGRILPVTLIQKVRVRNE